MSEELFKVLVVEDEESYVEALMSGLKREGFDLAVARDGEEAIELFDSIRPDVVLLDLMLPRGSGVDVCKAIRTKSSVPIIMVTARSSEIDTVVGLEVGADDYIAKPYRLRELVARVRAVLRRCERIEQDEVPGSEITVGHIRFNSTCHEVYVHDKLISLPLKEFELLGMLMSNVGKVLSRDAIIRAVWGEDYYGDTKTLDVHVKRLRSKIEDSPAEPVMITTVRGLGYKFETPVSVVATAGI